MLEAISGVVSNWPGSERAIESLAVLSSSAVTGPVRMRSNSPRISRTASAVTSVRTLVATRKGPGPRRAANTELAP